MMKLKAALQYRMIYQLKSLGIFYLYFIGFAVVLPGLAMFFSNTSATAESELTLPALIFAIILSVIGIRSDFKLFIQNGLNRLHIFVSNLISNFVIANVIVLAMAAFRLIFKTFFSDHFDYQFMILDFYQPKTLFSQYLLLFLIIFWGMALGLVIGLFLDRFSFIVRLLIGGGVLLFPILFGTVFTTLSEAGKDNVLTNLAHTLGITENGLKAGPLMLTLFILICVNLVLAYLMNRTTHCLNYQLQISLLTQFIWLYSRSINEFKTLLDKLYIVCQGGFLNYLIPYIVNLSFTTLKMSGRM